MFFSTKPIGSSGDTFGDNTPILTNRSGASTVLYATYALDVNQAQAESTTPDLGLSYVDAADTADLTKGILCVAQGVIADNAAGRFTLAGRTKLLVDGASSNIAKQDLLEMVVATKKPVKVSSGVSCAIALAAATTDGAVIEALFMGIQAFR